MGRWPWNFTENKDDYQGPTCDFSGVLDNSVAVCSMWTLGLYALDRYFYLQAQEKACCITALSIIFSNLQSILVQSEMSNIVLYG